MKRKPPSGGISLTDFRKVIIEAVLKFSERREFKVFFHKRPLCRVILEPL
jgi:hypothetical protein